MNILAIYKKTGETPKKALDRLRVEEPELKDETLSYAGRLDPLACGVMLVLVGEENKNREKYLDLDKEYVFEILFGVGTDTYDPLGLITKYSNQLPSDKQIESFVENLPGKRRQKYPPYSSKTVEGKPLFQWMREGKTPKIPEREIEIYEAKTENIYSIKKEDLFSKIQNKVFSVKGDFRQKDILECWKSYFSRENLPEIYIIAKIRISASSGTYIRAIANEVGEFFGSGAIALDIERVKVGDMGINECLY